MDTRALSSHRPTCSQDLRIFKPAHANWRVCVFTPASFGNYEMPTDSPPQPFAVWRVRRLDLDPMTSTVGDCTVVYLAKEGHEADSNPGTWQAELASGQMANLGSHSQIVISFDESGYVSVHTHAAWGLDGDYRRPVLLDSITDYDYALSSHKASLWACPPSLLGGSERMRHIRRPRRSHHEHVDRRRR